MRENVEKIIEVEKKISQENGKFNLFALFEREDIKDKWDVLISKNISVNKKNELISKIHKEFIKSFPKEVIFKFSRFVYLEPTSPIVQNINMMIHTEHTNTEITDSTINNFRIKHAYVITSQRT